MATYIAAYKGYITDVPELWFKRSDGKVFHYDKLTAFNATPNANFTEVNAGWSLFPAAYLPGQSTMEMQATSGEFNADLFAMANNTDFASGTVKTPHSLETAVGTDKKVEITSAASIKDSIIINGMTVGEAAADGVYTVAETGDSGAYTTTITFNNEMDSVEITYFTEDEGDVIEVSNSEAAMGELIAKWPVYANGTEVAAAGVKGYVLMDVFKCRVTQMPGSIGSFIQ